MPYDPILSRTDNYVKDEKGKTYQIGSDGKRHYIPDFILQQGQGLAPDDPKLLPPSDPRSPDYEGAGGMFRSRTMFDPSTGEQGRKTNWGTIAGLGIGGAIAAPFVAGALTGGGGGALASGGGASAAAPTTAAGSILPSSTIGAGFIPGITGAASGAIPTAATTGSSILGTVGTGAKLAGAAKDLAPILGNAAGAQQQQANAQNLADVARFNVGLSAPARRLATSTQASMIANRQPVKSNWGGPGSGLRGETSHFTGGYANPDLISPDTKSLAQQVMKQQLIDQMTNGGLPPPMAKESKASKALGAAATGASLLGAYGKYF